MFRTILRMTDRVLPIGVANAHCDIPCGIYDPRDAIQAAQTVIRMTELIEEMGAPSSVAEHNSFARYVAAKEEHATKAKDDILVIWTDYFKPEHLSDYPNLHELFWNADKLAGANKQGVSSSSAKELVDAVDGIAKIFWATKGVDYSDPNADVRFGA